MSPWLIYVLIILVTFRVTRMIIEDTFPPIGVPRRRLMNWWDPTNDPSAPLAAQPHWGAFGRSLRYLFSCPWCMSVWVGAAVVWIFTLYVSVPLPYAAWIVAAAGTGLIATAEDALSA